MIFRSVVGKLWITIVVLVSLIFLFLSIFLIEYFDHYYYAGLSSNLNKLGENISNILDEYPERAEAISTISEIINAYDSNSLIVSIDEKGIIYYEDTTFTDDELEEIIANMGTVVRLNNMSYKDFITFNSANDILAIAIPMGEYEQSGNAIIIYQSLNNLYRTTNYLKKIIFLFAGIGVVLTTILAFFLSSRITAPIREMQKAVNKMEQGDFHTKLNIKSSDEIGELALSFNRMASQLDETVQALSTEKEKLANVLKSMVDGIITINTQGDVIVINPPAEQLLYTRKEKELKLPTSLKGMFETVLKQKKSMEKDINIGGRIFSVVMAPLYSGDEIKGAVTLLRDVTYERKLNKLRKDFLANVSHELRTPISMLQGYSEAIIDDVAQNPEDKIEIAQIIYDESLRMGRLVNELLDLAKMESGNFQLQYCKVEVGKVLNKMVRKFSSIAQEHEIHFISSVDQYITEIYLDIDRIEQVLTNLIDNAIRHTPKGGSIILRAKLISIEKLLLEVEDAGIGIPEEDLPFVFERFYKADKARTRSHSGTGLGLSIVKNIVEAHGGTISVTSRIGQGTTFSIVIPTNKLANT